MKMRTQPFKLVALTFFICLSLGLVLSSAKPLPKSAAPKTLLKPTFFNARFTTIKSDQWWSTCGDSWGFFVPNSTDEIVLGMTIYINKACTTPAMPCYLIPQSGPAMGTLFQIDSSGLVLAATSSPSCP